MGWQAQSPGRIEGVLARALVLVVALGLVVSGCGPYTGKRSVSVGEPHVRVALALAKSDLVLRTQGPTRVQLGGAGWEVRSGSTLRVFAVPGGIRLLTDEGREHEHGADLLVHPGPGGAVSFEDVPYHGRLLVQAAPGGLRLVNEIALEDYLRGVVPWEIGRPGEKARAAIEAQAIVARTYAWSRVDRLANQGFDLYADIRDQVYRGALQQDPLANQAIESTRGLVLDHDGKRIDAYYSSTCGGHTSRIENVWSKAPRTYLRGKRDAPASRGTSFCFGSRHFRWTEAWSGAELERTLQETLPRVLRWPQDQNVGSLLDLQEVERDFSGRVLDLAIRTTTGTVHARGDSIRWVLRPRERTILRSLLFKLEVIREDGAIVLVIARGGGNGHGVGMCQTGALAMAELGYDRQAILQHYYPGTLLRHME